MATVVKNRAMPESEAEKRRSVREFCRCIRLLCLLQPWPSKQPPNTVCNNHNSRGAEQPHQKGRDALQPHRCFDTARGGRRTELSATAARRLLIVAPRSAAYPDFTSPGRGQARFDEAGGAGTHNKFSGRPTRESSPFDQDIPRRATRHSPGIANGAPSPVLRRRSSASTSVSSSPASMSARPSGSTTACIARAAKPRTYVCHYEHDRRMHKHRQQSGCRYAKLDGWATSWRTNSGDGAS